MKPNFALNLTDDSIGLLHRVRQGWMAVGETRFDTDDLEEAMGFLRATATNLAPKGITTKIVIPNSQILYTQVDAPGPDDAARRVQIRAALEGRTPYPVEDLVFDWSGEGAQVLVAVTARETLEQAEGFATQNKFNPISFVAIPPDGHFAGEPWFGATAAAAGILGKGKSVTRDGEAIVLLADTMGAAEPAPVVVEPIVAAPAPVMVTEVEPEPVMAEPEPEVIGQERPVAQVPDDVPVPPPIAPPPEPFQAAAEFVAPVVVDEAPFTHVADTSIADVPPVSDEDLPPAPSQAALIAFASRRAVDGQTKSVDAPRVQTVAPGTPPAPTLIAERLAARAQALAEGGGARPMARIDAGGRDGAFVTAPSIPGANAPGGKKRKGAAPGAMAPAAATVTDMPARKPLTKPGGTFATSSPARGKPRYLGLILTGILLLFLALVAAWSSFFLASRNTDAPTTAVATADPTAVDVATPDAPAVDDEMAADGQDPADFATTDATTDVATAAPEPAAPAPVVAPVAATPVPADVAVVEPAPLPAGPAPDTGVDATVPVAAAPDVVQDEIVLSTMDAPPPAGDAATLQQPTALADAPPTAQMPPPPFGTVYQFDAAGLILPTAEGVITPEGVRIVAGAPARVPPARPATLDTTTAVAAEVPAPVPTAEVSAAATFAANPALANARPRVRPVGLIPASATSGANVTTDAPIRSTSLIPRARPETILAAGEEARRATEAASLAASAAASAASEAVVLALAEPAVDAAGLSAMTVSVSRVPAPRPRNLDKAVAAALAAASRPAPAPEPEPQQQASADPAPEADAEPEVASAAPTLPISADVAKQATFVNAINLRQMNLIGVYGTQSNRYALIRQSNGRYKKVSVGDRIDGGTIAAITDDQVRYQKGGRMLALEMPRG